MDNTAAVPTYNTGARPEPLMLGSIKRVLLNLNLGK